MVRRTDTRDRLVRAAARLFRRQGFEATSMKELVAVADAPWGSLYHFFPDGKEQLAVETLRWSGAGFAALITQTLAESASAATAARRMFELAGEGLERSDFEHGCPIVNVAAESANRNEAMRRACSDVFDTWTDLVASRLRAEGVSPVKARELARFVVAAYEGAVTLARAHKDTAVLRATATHVVAAIKGHTAPAHDVARSRSRSTEEPARGLGPRTAR